MVSINTDGKHSPLFWIYGSEFIPILKTHFGEDQPIHFIHHQGANRRRAKYRTISEMANHYVRLVAEICKENDSVYLAGYSIGGLVAYEMAQLLSRRNINVKKLIMVSPATPKSLIETESYDSKNMINLQSKVRDILYNLRYNSPYLITKKFQNVSKSVRLNYAMRMGKLTPSQLWEYLQPIYHKAVETYEIEPYLGSTILIAEEKFNREAWSSMLSDCSTTPVLHCGHLEMHKPEHFDKWLPVFVETLN